MYLIPVSRRAASPLFSRSLGASLDALFGTRYLQSDSRDEPRQTPSIDVIESDAAYVVVLNVPGVTREQVKVSVQGRRVEIEAAPAAAELPEGQKLVYGERAGANFSRTLSLPVEVDSASSQAKLENGVLTLTLNKKVPTGATQLSIA